MSATADNRPTDGYGSDEHPHAVRGSHRARALNSYFARVTRPLMGASRYGHPALTPHVIRAMRPGINRSLVAMSPVPRGTRVRPVVERFAGGHVRGEWVGADSHRGRDLSARTDGTIIYYLHGSGYVICSPRTHRGLVARLGQATDCAAFSLDYRMGPEYRWPSAGDDAIRGYHWLLDRGLSADRIVIAGDSAGGHLAADLLADNQRTGTPQPAGMVLFSPLYDPTFELAVAHQRAGARDPIIDAVAAQRILSLYTAGADRDHPRMRVRLKPGNPLPPTLIQHGGLEVMGRDSQELHQMLLAAGADAELQVWPDQGHVFQMFPMFTPESSRAVDVAARFITRVAAER